MRKRDKQPVDYKTEGFLNGNYYQYIIKRSPVGIASGLVEKRESAYLDAKSYADKIPLQKLTHYCYSLYLSKHPVLKNDASKHYTGKLKQKLMLYIKKRYLYQEYYTRKSEAVLVFRIYKQGLKNEVDSMALSAE